MEMTAVPGSKVKVILPDSSTVWLNSNAKIRYPRRFSPDSRTVEFTGEAFFQVKKNAKAPFIVDAEGLKIQVVGTEFNVYAQPESQIIETTLLSGSVALFGTKNDTQKPEIILSPNQQALYNKKNGHIDIQHVRAATYACWINGLFIFEKNTLEEIMISLERAFNVKIHIEHDALKDQRLTARFVHQETLDEILSVLQTSAHYKYKKVKGEIYISKK
ncbi:FecR family protein [Parabacteroides pacaensis]|uniref:FecR family protein n=1 Tax=Parabacteroides pacaensis TaxID=2086575 RepID=UPI00131A9BB8|nr:FecR domain-containing protein [Parabacteroides pacaensis]